MSWHDESDPRWITFFLLAFSILFLLITSTVVFSGRAV